MGILGLIVDAFERETCFEHLIITYALDSLMSCAGESEKLLQLIPQ
jgi:hypothetical protein